MISILSLSAVILFGADEKISPEKAAEIARDQAQAQEDVSAKFGRKKSSELSADERKEMIRDQVQADKQVLEKHGIDAKTWQRESIKRDRTQYANQKKADQELAEKDKAKKAAAAKGEPEESLEIPVQRGFSNNNPVTVLENTDEKKVFIEVGLPPDFEADKAAAVELDRLRKAAEEPPRKGGGKRK